MARSVAPSSSAPASDVTMPASNAATTSRPSTGSNPNKSGIHSVGIGALRDSARNSCGTTLFADSPPRCTQFGEKSALARCRSHIHLGSRKLLLSVFGFRSSPLEDGTSRHYASFKITPERHQQLARQRHDGDAADAAFRGTDTRPEPDAQIAVGLIAQPQPGEFDPGGSSLAVTSLADPLVMRHVSALERARREADITRQLAAIVEVTMEYLANQHRGKLRTDRLELIEILDFLGVDMRRCFILNNRVALRFKSGDHLNHELQTLQFPLDL